MKQKIFTKDFLLNATINFLVMLIYYCLMVIMAQYAMEQLSATPSQAGLAAGLLIVAALITRIVSGKVIELIGRKKLIFIGLIVYLAAIIIYFFADSFLFLVLNRILHGIGFGITTTATATIVASIVPKERKGEGIGYYGLSITLASALGPFVGIYFYQYAGFDTILILGVILSVVNFAAAFFLKVPEVTLTDSQKKEVKRFHPSTFFESSALKIAAVGIVTFFCYSSIIGFLATYANSINLAEAGSVFFMVYSVSIVISRPFAGKLYDRKGDKYVIYPSLILFAIGMYILSIAQTGFVLLLSSVFLGLGFGTFGSISQAIAIKTAPSHRIGLATTTFLGISEMGIGLGPYILGLFIPLLGYRGVYKSITAVILIAIILYFILFRENKKINQMEEA